MSFKDYYSILEVSPQASQADINNAYKSMAKKWHPDLNKAFDTTKQMQLISEAYSILSNTERRENYNRNYYSHTQPNNYKQTKTEPNKEPKIEKCYYCQKNIAHRKFTYHKTFYKETDRNYFPQRKVWFKTVYVKIPRCEECKKIHESSSGIFLTIPLIAYSILGLVLGITIWGLWLLFLIIGAFVGGFIGYVLSTIDDSIIAKDAGIKKETDYFDFEPIKILTKDGWSTDKPTA